MKKPLPIHSKDILALAIITVFSFIAYFYLLSLVLEIPFFSLLQKIINALYAPHANIILSKPVAGILLPTWIYSLLLIMVCSLMFYQCLANLLKKNAPALPIKQWLPSIGLIALVLIAGLQQFGRMRHFINEATLYVGKTEERKDSMIFGKAFSFIQSSKMDLNKPLQGILLTDIDKQYKEDVNLFLMAFLKYHYYPQITFPLDGMGKKNFDCVLLYYKNNPLESIPEGFHIHRATNDMKYILAVKDSP
ncbi:MAG TPA: hypothetical protein VI749_00395 [Candidatus Omnitrophota bacterium]|nr:hypothetical protein [Candidatus Omnitrophota bacterium]